MKNLLLFAALFAVLLSSCGEGNTDDKANLNLDISGLENLGDDFAYEGWIIVDGSPITTGVFTVNDAGTLSSSNFELNADDLEKATRFVLTIEPSPDNDPAPSATHVLAGDFSEDDAVLSIDHEAALATDFSSASGKFILATPTDGGADTNEDSGIWFLDNSSGAPATGLNLPTLPEGWKYEGWVVLNGQPISTGTFISADGADEAAPFSGTAGGPPYPGEDFLNNAPTGLQFPVSLLGATAVISVEPSPDNSPAPFALKPLASGIDSNAATHSALDIANNNAAAVYSGKVSR